MRFIPFGFVLLGLTCCTASQSVPSHDLHALKGSFPHIGEPIQLMVNTTQPTKVQFPTRVSYTLADQTIPVKIGHNFEELYLLAEPELTTEGVDIKVGTVDGRQYAFHISPTQESEARKTLRIGSPTDTVERSINEPRASANIEALRLISALGGANVPGVSQTEEFTNTLFLSTRNIQAIVKESVTDGKYIAHRLQVNNITDTQQSLSEAMFTARGALAVKVLQKSLEAKPLTLLDKDLGSQHQGTVLIVTRK